MIVFRPFHGTLIIKTITLVLTYLQLLSLLQAGSDSTSSSSSGETPTDTAAEDIRPPHTPRSEPSTSSDLGEDDHRQTAQPFPMPPSPSPRVAQKRKRKEPDDCFQKHLSLLEERRVDLHHKMLENSHSDECSRFGQTVADMLRKLPEQHKAQAMFDVYKLLFERQQAANTGH